MQASSILNASTAAEGRPSVSANQLMLMSQRMFPSSPRTTDEDLAQPSAAASAPDQPSDAAPASQPVASDAGIRDGVPPSNVTAADLLSVSAEHLQEGVNQPTNAVMLDLSATRDQHEKGMEGIGPESTSPGPAVPLQTQHKQPGLSHGDKDTASSPANSTVPVAQPDELPSPVSRTYSTSSSTSSLASEGPSMTGRPDAQPGVSHSGSFETADSEELLAPAPNAALSDKATVSNDLSAPDLGDVMFANHALPTDSLASAATGSSVTATDRLSPVTDAAVTQVDAVLPTVEGSTPDAANLGLHSSPKHSAVLPGTASSVRHAMQSVFSRASKLSQASPAATAAPHWSSDADAKKPGEVSACRLHRLNQQGFFDCKACRHMCLSTQQRVSHIDSMLGLLWSHTRIMIC